MWIFGDAFIHAFYTRFEAQPMKRVGFQKADYRAYEKNGCPSTPHGPFMNYETLEDEKKHYEEQRNQTVKNQRKRDTELEAEYKRNQNWGGDEESMSRNSQAEQRTEALGLPIGGYDGGYRFRNGQRVKRKFTNQLRRLFRAHRRDIQSRTGKGGQTLSPEEAPEPSKSNQGADHDPKVVPLRRRKRPPRVPKSGVEKYLEEDDDDDYDDYDDELDVGEPMITLLEKESSEAPTSSRPRVQRTRGPKPRRTTTSPRTEKLSDFFARRDKSLKLRDDFKRAARADRIKHGVEPEIGRMRFASKRGFASSMVTLPKDEVKGEDIEKEVQRNMSLILRSLHDDLNITGRDLRGWWRGESEEFIEIERKVC